jgi:hypothetical protein
MSRRHSPENRPKVVYGGKKSGRGILKNLTEVGITQPQEINQPLLEDPETLLEWIHSYTNMTKISRKSKRK